MYISLGLFLFASGGISVLFLRHMKGVRAFSQEELVQFIDTHPSPFHHIKQDYLSPFYQWCRHTVSFLFYHVGEWVVRRTRFLLLYAERQLKKIGDYLHGRKIVMRKKGQSPFWDSMHEWKEELKNGSGEEKKL
ncbi:MAG: hypothetical protein Q8O83_01455 [bacterium]|nr:hypothetical protein [bacterium]